MADKMIFSLYLCVSYLITIKVYGSGLLMTATATDEKNTHCQSKLKDE